METYPSLIPRGFDFGWPAGGYRISINAHSMSTNALSTSAHETMQPFWVPRRTNIVALAFPLTTSQSGAECRLGLYEDSDGEPGAIIVDAGTIDLSSGSGAFKDTSAIDITLEQGWIWTCCQMKNVATQASSVRNGGAIGFIAPTYSTVSANNNIRYLSRSITYGSALLSTASGSLAPSTSGADGVMIALKSAS